MATNTDEQIDSRLPYRVGCPILPSLPVTSEACDQETSIPNFAHHWVTIVDILARYDVGIIGHYCAYRLHDGVAIADRFRTLVIASEYEHGCQDRWIKAVKEIRTSLTQSGIYWAIELIDVRAHNRPLYTAPILSTDHDLIEGWNSFLPEFLPIIKYHDWVAIDVFYRELPSGPLPGMVLATAPPIGDTTSVEMRPTIIISARDADSDVWWNSTLPVIHQLLQSKNLGIDVVLLFLKGIDLIMASSPRVSKNHTDPHDEIISKFHTGTPNLGSSIGASGSTLSGTLGGRIKLRKGSSVSELGLTNYHVLREAFTGQETSEGPFRPDAVQLYGAAVTKNILSPSECDYEFACAKLRKDLEKDDPRKEEAGREADEENSQRNALEEDLKNAEDFSCHLGSIYAASGYRSRENPDFELEKHKEWLLDWCLVQTDPAQRYIENRIPDTISGSKVVNKYCSISALKNYEVKKRGRTSCWTKGTISAIESMINPPVDLPEPDIPTHLEIIRDAKRGDNPLLVHGIIGNTYGVECGSFLYPGDSGSLVLLDQDSNIPGEVIVGLGFARNRGSWAGYMMPMDVVVHDIEEVTGGEVIQPKFKGIV